MSKARNIVIVVAVLLIVIAAATAGGMLTIPRLGGVDEEPKIYLGPGTDSQGWVFQPTFASGDFFDSRAYVSGFYGGDFSEKIVVQGTFARQGANCYYVSHYRILVDIKSAINGTTYTLVDVSKDFGDVGFCPATETPPAYIAQVPGNDYGVLHFSVWANVCGLGVDCNKALFFSEQNSVVQPGWGVLKVQNANALALVGQTVDIFYDVGQATSTSQDGQSKSQGWLLTIVNLDGGAEMYRTTLANFVTGTLHVPVTADWFHDGSKNQYEVRLFNQINLQSAAGFVTVDDVAKAPSNPKVAFDPAPPFTAGQLVSISASSSPGSLGYPIQSFHFRVLQGSLILLDTDSPQANATFTIHDNNVDISFYVTAFDGHRSSGVTQGTLKVQNSNVNNNNSPNNPPGLGNFPLWLVLGIVAVVLVLLAVFVKRIPLIPWKVVLVVFAGVLVVVAVVV